MTPEASPESSPWPLRRGPALASAAALLLFAGAGLYFSYHESIWYDEACSMTSARGPLRETLERANRFEQQPPLYFLVLNLWLRLHRSIGFARMLSLAAALAGALLTARAFVRASREASPWAYPVALALLLCSPFVMWFATEIRGYAMQFALGSLLASTLADVHARKSASRTDVSVLLGAGVVLAYFNYLAAFAAACVTVSLVLDRSLSLRQAAVVAIGGIVLTSPLLITVREHVQTHTETTDLGLRLEAARRVFYWMCWLMVPGAVARGSWQIYLATAVGLAVAGGAVLRTRAEGRSFPSRPFLAATGLTIALFLAVGLLAGPSFVQDRYLSAFFAVLWICSLLLMRYAWGWTPAVILMATLSAACVYRVAAVHGPGIRRGDWRRIAVRIDRDPPLPTFVFPPQEALCLREELGDPARVEAFPHPFDATRVVSIADFDIGSPERLRAEIARRVGAGRFWLSFTDIPVAPWEVKDPIEIPRQFIDRSCTVVEDIPFRGARLLLLRLRPDDR